MNMKKLSSIRATASVLLLVLSCFASSGDAFALLPTTTTTFIWNNQQQEPFTTHVRRPLLSRSWLVQQQRGRTAAAIQNTDAAASAASSSSPSTSQEQKEQQLSDQEEHAREVFLKFQNADGHISTSKLSTMLRELDIEATEEEADALFRYLDVDGSHYVDFDEFLPWYRNAVEAAQEVADSFQSLIIGRRTVDVFDQTPVSDDVLRRAVQCAIAAPNRSMSEPWRFIKIGPHTVEKFAQLNRRFHKNMETENGRSSVVDWTTIPGWCVVTNKLSPNDDPNVELEDFKSTSCAIQNFMLSMWSEGVGTKWTSGPVQHMQEFADLCGVDTTKEKVVGCIWYGFASGGTKYADPRRRKKKVDDVLSIVP